MVDFGGPNGNRPLYQPTVEGFKSAGRDTTNLGHVKIENGQVRAGTKDGLVGKVWDAVVFLGGPLGAETRASNRETINAYKDSLAADDYPKNIIDEAFREFMPSEDGSRRLTPQRINNIANKLENWKANIGILTARQVMDDGPLSRKFEDFLTKEYSSEIFNFLRRVEPMLDQNRQLDPREYNELRDQFILDGAREQVNLSTRFRETLEIDATQLDNAQLQALKADLDTAFQCIMNLANTDNMPRFKRYLLAGN